MLKRRVRYGILGRNKNDTYWVLEYIVKSQILALILKILYKFKYDETEIREQNW